MPDDYEVITKEGYTTSEQVLRYHRQMTKRCTWAWLMMSREISVVGKMLNQLLVKQENHILDVPCGTGILSSVLGNLDVKVLCADISTAMIKIAQEEYNNKQVSGFCQTDITQLPFRNDAFPFVIVIGLMHRLPRVIRQKALYEVSRVSQRYIIISNSVDNYTQNIKRKIIHHFKPNHIFAPNPIKLNEIYDDFTILNLRVRKVITIFPIISAEKIFLLDKY